MHRDYGYLKRHIIGINPGGGTLPGHPCGKNTSIQKPLVSVTVCCDLEITYSEHSPFYPSLL